MTKTIGVIAIKGGVGKTTTVVNLGSVLANDFKKRVLIVDGNFSAPNLGLHIGVVDPKNTLHDVLTGKLPVTQAIYQHDHGFHFMPANLIHKKIDVYKLKQKLHEVRNNYDVIVIDSSPNLNHEMLSTMVASDELLVVSTPDYPTLSATMNAVRIAKQRRTPISGIVLNKVRNKRFELTMSDIEDATNTPILAVLHDDIKVLEALSETMPYSMHSPNRNSAIEYKKLAGALIGEKYNDSRFSSKIKRIFKSVHKPDVNRDVYRDNIQ